MRPALLLVALVAAAAVVPPADALAAAAAKKKKAAAAAAAAGKGDAVLVSRDARGRRGWREGRRGREGACETRHDGDLARTHTHTKRSQVTCGSAVKLTHAATGANLHSHEVAYGSGSHQQSVTGVRSSADAGSVWLVKPRAGAPCAAGEPLAHGAVVRLQHAATRRWLHSHHFPSPLSGALEVSAFGGDAVSDHLDDWALDVDGGGAWAADAPVRFKHVETGAWLSATGRTYGPPIAGHVEVVAAPDKKGAAWTAGEGVYVVGRVDES